MTNIPEGLATKTVPIEECPLMWVHAYTLERGGATIPELVSYLGSQGVDQTLSHEIISQYSQRSDIGLDPYTASLQFRHNWPLN